MMQLIEKFRNLNEQIKIRLRMWQVNCNYERDDIDTKFLLCQNSEDTTKFVLKCEEAIKFTLRKENSKKELEERTEIFRKK